MKKSTNFEPYWDLIKRIITESDLVLEVLDARMVEISRNKQAEKLIKEEGRPLVFVVNKSDLVSKNFIKKQIKNLRKEGDVVFISTKEKGSARLLFYIIKKTFKKFGKRIIPPRDKFAPKPLYREAKGDIVVGVLGYPNVGKSSIINMLAHRKKTKVSKKAGTTHGIHWIKATNEIKLIDSPGVIPFEKEDELKYSLLGIKNPEKLKNPETTALNLIKLFSKYNKKNFENFYKIKLNSTPEKTLKELSKKKNHLLKGNTLDLNRTSVMIVRDWQHGKLNFN